MEFEHEVADARIARLSALIATVNGDGKKTYEPSDFMPKKRGSEDEEEQRQTPEQTAEAFKSLALSMGGRVVNEDGSVIEAPSEPSANGSG